MLSAGAKKRIKAAHGMIEKQPDVEEGGVKADAKQKDVFYKVRAASGCARGCASGCASGCATSQLGTCTCMSGWYRNP